MALRRCASGSENFHPDRCTHLEAPSLLRALNGFPFMALMYLAQVEDRRQWAMTGFDAQELAAFWALSRGGATWQGRQVSCSDFRWNYGAWNWSYGFSWIIAVLFYSYPHAVWVALSRGWGEPLSPVQCTVKPHT
jgi:hypothetical protein